jgi:hypothetical protein
MVLQLKQINKPHTQPPPCNLPEGSLLVCIQFPYSLPPIGSLPLALALHVLYKPSTSLPCHFSPEDGDSMFLQNAGIDQSPGW